MAYQGAAAALALLLGGCSVPDEVNPVQIYRRISGAADQGRPPPPGLDRPFPNLAQVPPRPERPPLAAREAVSGVLEADRGRSRTPLEPGPAGPGEQEPSFAAAPGNPPLPAGPPPRAALVGAAPIPWDLPPDALPAAAPRPLPGPAEAPRPLPGPAAMPPAAGAAPAPGATTPAAALPEMPAAPPPPPSSDLLAPRPSAGPPPLPPPDLLGPASRR